jgi:uncharacterized protein (TIGR02001 family)
MKIFRTFLAVVAIGFCAACATLSGAQAAELETSGDVSIYSAYVWRGIVINDEAVMQPALTVSKGGFSANVWGNFDFTDSIGTEHEFSEIDITLSYTWEFEMFGLEIGYVEYLFPNTSEEGTREIFATCSVDILLSPTVTLYYDVDEIDGLYVLFSAGHSLEVTEVIGLDLGAGVGLANADYNDGYFGVDDGAFVDMVFSADLSWAATDNITLSGGIAYMALLDSSLKDASSDDDKFYGNVTFSYLF